MTSHASAAASAQPGDIVQLDYDLWAVGPGGEELIATTEEAVASKSKANIPEGYEFGPRPHLIGGDKFPPGIEKALAGLTVGENLEREFPPSDAYGERDPKLIELFSMHEISRLPEMRRDDAHLDVGTVLTIRGRRGRVASLTAARVRVDFNPPYSGRPVRARFRVVRKVEEPVDRVRALVELVYGRSKDFNVEIHANTVTVTIPDRTKFDLNWFAAKSRLIERVRAQLKPKAIRFVEEYETPVSKGEATSEASAGKGLSPKSKAADSTGATETTGPAPEPPAHATTAPAANSSG